MAIINIKSPINTEACEHHIIAPATVYGRDIKTKHCKVRRGSKLTCSETVMKFIVILTPNGSLLCHQEARCNC
jgi:hypothetical protein